MVFVPNDYLSYAAKNSYRINLVTSFPLLKEIYRQKMKINQDIPKFPEKERKCDDDTLAADNLVQVLLDRAQAD